MAKSPLQIISFLSCNSIRSRSDWDMITSYCRSLFSHTELRLPSTYSLSPDEGLTASQFLEWIADGFAPGDIVLADNIPAIIGISHFKASQTLANIQNDKLVVSTAEVPKNRLKIAPDAIRDHFLLLLLHNSLQFSFETHTLTQKYIPSPDERVFFYNAYDSGLGVIRSLDPQTGSVTLSCWFRYSDRSCGFSHDSSSVCSLSSHSFCSLDRDSGYMPLNRISCQRRLNSELAKYGKTWNQSRHRIDPLLLPLPKGKKYWYISDRLQILQDTENGYQSSRDRMNAGNYFHTRKDAETVLSMFNGSIRSFMRSPDTLPLPKSKTSKNN